MIEGIQRLAAFCDGDVGGNPAGVALLDALPDAQAMQRAAAEIGYSETAFLAPQGRDDAGRALFRVRYFAPEMEVPFCGHATIASGAALGARFGAGLYALQLNEGAITVAAEPTETGGMRATLTSPPTWSEPAPEDLTGAIAPLFGLGADDLDGAWRPALAGAGAKHLFLALKSRGALSVLGQGGPIDYPLAEAKKLMDQSGLVTIGLFWTEGAECFHVRNAFAAGGVAEDPATGAAAAAFAGLLRDLGRLPADGRFEILQGADMRAPSRIYVEASAAPGAGVRVSGAVRRIQP